MTQHAKAASAGSTAGRGKSILATLALAICASALLAAPALAAPILTIGSVSNVSYDSVHVTGTVDANDFFSVWGFEYSTDGATWSPFQSPPGQEVQAGTGPQPVEADLTGLKGGTHYFVRLAALNNVDTFEGSEALSPGPDPEFETLPVTSASVLSTDDATEVSYVSAMAAGEIERPANPDPAFDADCRFEYVNDAQFAQSGFQGAAQIPCGIDPLTTPEEKKHLEVRLTGLAPSTTYHLRLTATNAGPDESLEAADTFTTLTPTAPTLALDPPGAVSASQAHISATVDPEGGNIDSGAGVIPILWQLQYALASEPGNWQLAGAGTIEGDPAKESNPITVAANSTGLTPDSEYRFRLLASYAGLEAISSEGSFETGAVTAPSVSIDPIAGLTATGAHFSGKVNPNGTDPAFNSAWHFECTPECLVPDPAHAGDFLPLSQRGGEVSADGSEHVVSVDVSNLEPNTSYEVELLASNPGGPGEAGPVPFKTSTLAPTVQTLYASEVEAASATLAAKVNPHNSPLTYQFEYGLDTSYGALAPAPAVSLGEVDNVGHEVSTPVAALQEDSTYHFRITATNTETDQTTHGVDHTFTTPPAAGPVPCANEQLRAENSSLNLPDCRAYELVSPVKKNGFDAGAPNGDAGYSVTTVDGNAVLYASRGPMGTVSRGLQEYTFGRRSTDGWSAESAIPAGPADRIFTISHQPSELITSSDLTKLVFAATGSFVADNPESAGTSAALYEGHLDGTIDWLSRPQIPNPSPPLGAIGYASYFQPVGAAPDLSTVYFWASQTLLPEDAARTGGNGWGLYEYSDGVLKPAGTLPPSPGHPDGTEDPGGAAPAGALSYGGNRTFPNTNADTTGNQVSRDGSTLFFVSPDPEVSPLTQLYVRRNGHSTLVSHTPAGAPAPSGVSSVQGLQFAYGSPDGTSTIFQSVDALSPGAPNDSSIKAYRYDVAADTVSYLPGVGGGSIAAASDDGQRFLIGMANQVEARIAVWDHGTIKTLASGFARYPGLSPARATASGSAFVFTTPVSIDGANSGGVAQVYRYDLAEDKTTCLSCPPDATVPSGDAHFALSSAGLVARRGISTDAGRVFFDTPDPLVPADTNGTRDAYEWTPSGVALISSGKSPEPSYVLDNSASGDDVFFATAEDLDPRDTDSVYDVYDARVGGGFRQAAAVSPCLGNDVCRDPSAPPPSQPSPATSSFSGEGEKPRARSGAEKIKVGGHQVVGGTLKLKVTLPKGGTVAASGKGLASTRHTYPKAGRYQLKLTLKPGAKKALREKHELKLKVHLRFSPKSGKPSSANVVLTVKG